MPRADRDVLKVDVPVGFLLSEYREVVVNVDRPGDAPLALRLRLIPAAADAPDFGAAPFRSAHDTPAPVRRLSRLTPAAVAADHDLGGSD